MIRVPAALALTFSLALAATASSASAQLPALTVLTEEYPPFIVKQDTHAGGPYIEAFQRLAQEQGIAISLELIPIRRAIATAQSTPGVCVLALDYAPSNAEVLLYLGRVAPEYVWAYARHGEDIHVRSIADLKRYSIGIEDIAQVRRQLDEANVHYVVLTQKTRGPQMLQAHRFDILIGDVGAELEAVNAGIALDKLYTVAGVERWIACNPNSDAAAMSLLRGALTEGLFSESVHDIWNRYGLGSYFLQVHKSWVGGNSKP